MKNNQTAVEWLQSIELERDLTLADWKQAKAMEKQQIKDAANWGTLYSDSNKSAEQYYNETYGGNQ